YVGENKDGFPNGQGTMTWSNGVEYVGEYKDGKPNGQGTVTYSDGEKCVGEWKNVGFRNGKCYDKNGNIQYKYVNGKRIRQ
ncbi:membrane-binding protein, partial [bacterium]|nr:membrane-binding protein [bacterium]